MHNGAWLASQDFAPLHYAVPGLLPEGFTVLAGPPKAGKSWLVLDWLLAIAAGGRAISSIPIGGARPVLYLALEDSDRRMQERCRALLGRAPAWPERFWYKTEAHPGALFLVVDEFLGRFPDAGLVVVDTLGKVMPRGMNGETTYDRDYRIGSEFHLIAKRHPGLAVIACHHTRQAESEDFVEKVSGTSGLIGAADTVAVLTRSRFSGEGLLKMTGRDIAEEQYALTSRDGIWRLAGADLAQAATAARELAEAQQLGELSRQIIAWVRQQPGGAATTKEITDKFGPGARMNLCRLTDAGYLEKLERGRYAVPGEDQP
jgi:RecA-family ATPase